MKIITLKEYSWKKNKNGLFVFTLRNSCGLCSRAVSEISNYDNLDSNFPEIIEVACETEDELFEIDLMIVPVFRLYKNDQIIWQKGGILYDKQIKEMLEVYGK